MEDRVTDLFLNIEIVELYTPELLLIALAVSAKPEANSVGRIEKG